MGINDIIRLHRQELRISQGELASRVYREQQYISDLETGRKEPDTNDLIILNNIFGCEVIKCYAIGKRVEPVLNMTL